MSHQFCVCALCCLCLSCRRSNTRRWPKVGLLLVPVYDAESTLAQYWVTVSCLTSHWMWTSVNYGWMNTSQHRQRWPNVYQILGRCRLALPDPQLPANTKRWTSAGFMLGQGRKRWARIGPALGQRLVFAESVDRQQLCFAHHRVWIY